MSRYISTPRAFQIETATKEDLKHLSEQVDNFIEILEEVMVIPNSLKKSEPEIEAAKKMTKKLIKRLKAGNFKVFKDFEEWNMLP